MNATQPRHGWVRTSSGVLQREADEAERYYAVMATLYEGSGRVALGITGFLSLSIAVETEAAVMSAERRIDTALAKAWLALRFDHPTIASQVLKDHQNQTWVKVYRRFLNETDPVSWLDRSLLHVSTEQTGYEWANANPPAPLTPTLFVVHPPVRPSGPREVRRDLVFRSPHDTIDGIGTLLMYDKLLQHVSSAFTNSKGFVVPVCDGSEIANLSPPFCTNANILPTLSPAQNGLMEFLFDVNQMAEKTANLSTLALPFKPGAVLPGRHQRAATVLSEEKTSHVLRACNKAGFTAAHVFHAAVVMVLRDLQLLPEQSKPVHYVGHILHNSRDHCSIPCDPSEHPVSVCHSVPGQDLTVDIMLYAEGTRPLGYTRRDEFIRVAQITQKFYQDLDKETQDAALTSGRWASLTPALPCQPRPYPLPPPQKSPSVSLLDMGQMDDVVQKQYGKIRIHDAWITQEELGNGLSCYIGTFAGRLSFSAVYNEAWHELEEISEFLESCIALVFEGLELGMA
ncbi:hypothetical protein HJFPF1_08267 [Paramyrothecium foliicola]|nr:hypothetical protein HJFPF1_08267 [Paramyrothecium foliicola]